LKKTKTGTGGIKAEDKRKSRRVMADYVRKYESLSKPNKE